MICKITNANFILLYLCRKYIEIDIVDDEDYQKNESFFVELGEPISEFNEKNGKLRVFV